MSILNQMQLENTRAKLHLLEELPATRSTPSQLSLQSVADPHASLE